MKQTMPIPKVSNVRRFKPYRASKPSGIEWLGDIPTTWSTSRVKHLASIRYGLGEPPEYSLDGLPFIRATDIKSGTIDLASVKRVNAGDVPWSRRPRLDQDEILVVRSGAYTGDSAIVSDKVAGCIAGYDMVLTARNANPHFLGWVLLSKYMLNGQIYLERMRAAQPHLNAEELGSFIVLVPPEPDQRAIAAFLDRETAKIDTLITKKRALVEKLNEKRSALVSHTVTRGLPPDAARDAGLDPHPPLKPSGVKWLGAVPAHWDVKQLKWAIMFQRGHDLPTDQREEGSIPLVTSSGESATHSVAVARGPGIVTGRYGTIGKFYMVERDYWPLNTTLYSIDLRGNEPRFLQRMLTNLSPLFLLNAVKSAVPGVDRNDIHPVTTAVPPVLEQRAIADFLDRETAKIDQMVTKVEAAIHRLLEYRIALITAAVTGKIDVRGVPA
jgi:type I restriction enzyme S subunit